MPCLRSSLLSAIAGGIGFGVVRGITGSQWVLLCGERWVLIGVDSGSDRPWMGRIVIHGHRSQFMVRRLMLCLSTGIQFVLTLLFRSICSQKYANDLARVREIINMNRKARKPDLKNANST